MDLPTYTNIWRIEKRLYKLYDFRLPAPLPITWIAVFTGITVPYIFFLVVIGVPFNHNLVWLYVLPPGVLTWLTTRPVIESKRLPELVSSQLRYLSEPRTWCRMTPFAEKDDVNVSVRVWHRHPPGARPKKARPKTAPKAAGRDRSAGRAPETAAARPCRWPRSGAPAVAPVGTGSARGGTGRRVAGCRADRRFADQGPVGPAGRRAREVAVASAGVPAASACVPAAVGPVRRSGAGHAAPGPAASHGPARR